MRRWPSLPGVNGPRASTRRRRLVAVLASALLVAGSATACSESDPVEEGTGRDAAVLEEIVRELTGEPLEPDELPVTFVMGVDGTIGIEVQAAVAAALVEEIDVRFADERVEAIDEGDDDRPVRDGGVLLVVQDIPVEGENIDVQVDRYETFDDGRRMVVSLQFVEPDWVVTSAAELEQPES